MNDARRKTMHAWTPIASAMVMMLVAATISRAAIPNPVAYWPLRDGTPGDAVAGADDLIDNGSHPATDAASTGGGGTWAADPERGIVYRTVQGHRLTAGTQGITTNFTWSLWVKILEDNNGTIMGTRAGNPWNKLTTGGMGNWAGFNFSSGTIPQNSDWKHIVVRGTVNAGGANQKVECFMDGAAVGTDNNTASVSFNGALQLGGNNSWSEDIGGMMSDVAVWTQALSNAQITELYNGSNIITDTTAPVAIDTTPDDDDGNASSELIQMIFDEPVVVGSGNIRIVNDTDTVTTTIPVTDGAQVTVSGAQMTIDPTTALIVGKAYHIEMDAGVVKNIEGINFAGIADSTTWNFVVDNTPPTVSSIDDNVGGGPIYEDRAEVTYTVTFDEPIDGTTVDTSDFDNAGTAAMTVSSVTQDSDTQFTVVVAPTTTGSLQLRIPTGSVVNDMSGNSLVVPVTDGVITISAGTDPSTGDRWWDPSSVGVTDGTSGGGAGTWSTSDAEWDRGVGFDATVAWNNGNSDSAIFGGTPAAVALSGSATVSNISFTSTSGGYDIQSGTLNFVSGATIANSDNRHNHTFSCTITGSPGVETKDYGAGNQYHGLIFAPSAGHTQTLGAVVNPNNSGNTDKAGVYLSGSTVGNSVASVTYAGGDRYGTVYVQGTGSWTSGDIRTGTLRISGGNLVMNGEIDTDYSGCLLTGGVLHYNNAGAVKEGTFNLQGGSLDNSSGSAITTSTYNPAYTVSGNFAFIGSNGASSDLNLGSGAVTLSGATRTVTVQDSAATLTIGGIVGDGGNAYGLTKAGDGTLALGGANTYTGPTTVNAGRLQVDGALPYAGTVSVGSGGTVGGAGTVGIVSVASGGTVAPGASTGTLGASNVTIAAGGTLSIEIDDGQSPKTDTLAVSNVLDIAGATLDFDVTGSPNEFAYTIATYGSLSGTFGTVNGMPSGYTIDYVYDGGTAIAIKEAGGETQPVATNLGATAVGIGTATLRGEMTDGTTGDAYICWGASDAGTSGTGVWQHVESIGSVSENAPFATNLTSVYYGVDYNYRVYVTNSIGDAWSAVTNFSTLWPIAPSLGTLNWDFETGDLTDWTNVGTGVGADTLFRSGNNPVSHSRIGPKQGTYYVDGYSSNEGNSDGWTGIVETDSFVLGANAAFTMVSGGGTFSWSGTPASPGSFAGIALEREVSPGTWENVIFQSGGGNSLVARNWDASAYEDDTVRLRIYDTTQGGWGWTAVDDIEASNVLIPSGDSIDITNTAAENVATTTADLVGILNGTGSVFDVTVYWGTNDHADGAAWLADGTASKLAIGTYTNVTGQSVTESVGSLSAGTVYYYTMVASNDMTNIWATPNAVFGTDGPPTLINDGYTPELGYATLSGNVVSTGGLPVAVRIYWGETDGGTTLSAWENTNIFSGTRGTGSFSTNTTGGLVYGVQYYYRCTASNANGLAWAPATSGFVTGVPLREGLLVTDNLVAWYDAGVGVTTNVSGVVQSWADQSGNGYDAVRQSGSPTLVTGALNSKPEIQCRSRNSYFAVNHNIFVKEQYVVGRAATANWNNYGAYFANKSGRSGSYLFQNGNTGFHNNQYPSEVSRDGVVKSISTSGTLVPMQDYMVLKIVVNNNNTTPRQYWIGRSDHSVADLDVLEIIGYGTTLEDDDEISVGGYLAAKYGISTDYDYTPPPAISIANQAVSPGFTATSATFNATFEGPDSVFDVYVYWGTSDGGTDAGAWGNTNLVASYDDVASASPSFYTNSLVGDTTYYYAFCAQNAATNMWAQPSTTFQTIGSPTVGNSTGAVGHVGYVTLNGVLTKGGEGDVTICWGTSDAGTNSGTAAWDHAEPMGINYTGIGFSSNTVGAWYGPTYYYRCYATNDFGDDWSDVVSFTVPRQVLGTNALTHYGYMISGRLDSDLDFTDGGGLMAETPVGETLLTGQLDINGDAAFRALIPEITRNDDYQNLFLGYFDAHADGNYQFLTENTDDRQTFWLDLDQDGTFERPGANGDERLTWHNQTSVQTALSNGERYRVAIGHMEHGGGARTRVRFVTPSLGWRLVNPTEGAQDGMWLYDAEAPLALSLVNNTVSNVIPGKAHLNGTLTAASQVYDVRVYWGKSDHNTDKAAWIADGGSHYLGSYTNVSSASLTYQATGLDYTATYYYRYLASNALEEIWAAPAESFETFGVPTVANTGASDTDFNVSATLNGDLTAGGQADIYVCWGPANMGTGDTSAWANVELLAGETCLAPFATNVTGLLYGIPYYYTCFATNSAGGDWSTVTSFLVGKGVYSPNGLRMYGYHINNDGLALNLHNNAGMMGGGDPTTFQQFYGEGLLTAGPGNRGLDFNGDSEFQNHGIIGQNNNYSTLFLGYLRALTDGDYQFKRNHDDDRMGIWLDLDQDGVFESNPTGLGSDRGEQLQWDNDSGIKTKTLTAGYYLFATAHREGGGGSGVDVGFKAPSMGSMTTIRPTTDANQNGMWFYESALNVGVTNTGITGLLPGEAGLNGTLFGEESVYDVWAYWATNNHGTDRGAWLADTSGSNVYFGTFTNVASTALVHTATGLASATTYYYNFHGSNQAEQAWGNAYMFGSAGPPVVENSGATNIDIGTASLQGVLSAGGLADIYVCWGDNPAGADTGAWDYVEYLGTNFANITFSADVTGAHYGITYYYRCFATNSLGSDWANSATNFATLMPYTEPAVLPITNNLEVWYSAGQGITTNVSGVVTGWADQSGNGRDLVSWTGSPTYEPNALNERPAVSFNGNNWNLQMSAPGDTYFAKDVYLVFRSGNGALFGPNWGAPFGVKDGNDNNRMWMLQPNEDRFWGNELPSAVTWNGITVTSAGNFDMSAPSGGASMGEYMVLQVEAGPNNGTHAREYIVGTRMDAWGDSRFHTAEVIAYNTALLPAEREALGGYLAWKYGITTTYPTFAPDNTGTIDNTGASDLAPGQAQLNATLSCTGAVYDVWVYWSTSDHGTNAANWIAGGSSAHVGTYTNVATSLSHTAGSLAVGTPYYYAFRGTNQSTEIWGEPAASFTSMGAPTVDNDGGATDIGVGTATLRGELTGGGAADIYVCWGTSDGGASTAAWEHVEALGQQVESTFSTNITGTYYGISYYYRCYATNFYGSDWADSTTNFMTLQPEAWVDATGWSFTNWTGDADSGITNDYTYTAAHSFGDNHAGVTVNGVSFVYNFNQSGSGWTSTGLGAAWGGDDDAVITGDSEDLAEEFRYNGNPETFQFSGLTAGTRYKTTFFSVAWEASGRWQTFLNNASADSLHVAQDHYGNNYGITMSYVFDATGATEDFTITPDVGNSTFHCYALANREVGTIPVADIANAPPSDRGLDTVTLNATISITGSVFDVHAYWGNTDHTTNAGSWASNAYVGTYTNVVDADVSYGIGGMGAAGTPYYTFRLSNEVETVWAEPSEQVTTISAPEVINDAPSVAVGSATLAGELTAGTIAHVYIYWGMSDGGTTKANWDNYELLSDTPQGTFSDTVAAGYGMTNYYRCYATNAVGDDWANATTNFTTLPAPTVPVSPNALYYGRYTGSGSGDLGAIDDGVANGENGGLFDLTPDGGAPTVWTSEIWPGGDGNNYSKMWWGYFQPPLTGTYEFYVHGDDYELLWIDVDQNDGEFEQYVDDISRNVPPEGWNTAHTETVPLDAGEFYAFAIAMNEGGGGDWMQITIKKPGGAAERINPSTPSQDGWWSLGIQPPTLSITNDAITGVSTNLATMNGTLMATGWVFDVWAYWNTSDGGTNAANWTNSAHIGWVTNYEGALSYEITGLTELTSYYCTFRATNQLTDMWAEPSKPFGTLGAISVDNLAAASVTATSAVLRAQLQSGGTGDAIVYWGTTDRGASPVGWDHSESFPGVVMDPFETNVTVRAGGTYYYRTYASNAINTAWAPTTESFTVPQAAVTLSIAGGDFDPTTMSGCVAWFDAGVGVTTNGSGVVQTWNDRSGNNHHATLAAGDPVLASSQVNGRPAVQFRSGAQGGAGDEYLNVSGLLFAREIFMVWRSPSAAFSDYGGIFGQMSGRPSNFLVERNNTTFHNNQYPEKVSKDGAPLRSPFDMSPVTDYMVLRVVVNAGDTAQQAYQIGRNDGWSFDMDLAEVIAFDDKLTLDEESQVGGYLAGKYGIDSSYPVFLDEAGGQAVVTASLNVPAISDVTVNVTLGGGLSDGLTHSGYHNNPWNDSMLDLNNNGGLMAMTPHGTVRFTDGPGDRGLDFNDDNDFINSGAVSWGDNYQNLFMGYFIPPTPGDQTYGFRNAGDDDRAGIWVDLDRDGVFESSSAGLGSNRGEQLSWEDGGNKNVTLTGGLPYLVAFTHAEGGGGSRCDFRFTRPGFSETIVKPGDPAQAGMWVTVTDLAAYPGDYTASATSVVIPAGSLSSNIVLTVVDDVAQEEDEGFKVSIASVLNATNGAPASVTGTINSLDPEVTLGDGFTGVSVPDATLNGVLTMGDGADVTIYWGTSDGGTTQANWGATCVVGTVSEDVPFSTNITGLAGGVTYYYRCYATNGSNLAEDWSDVASTSMPPALITIDDVVVTEGDSGTVDAVFTIGLSSVNAASMSVDYDTVDNTATDGSDYTGVSGTVTIPAGQTSTQITVTVAGDTVFEHPDEIFYLDLSDPVNGTISDGRGVCTITDEDAGTYLVDWRNRMEITLGGYAGTETLTNWPALVRLTEGGGIPGFDYDQFASGNGLDLRFANAAGTRVLHFEIENWDTGGESAVWVKLPELPAGGTTIWAYWGNPLEAALPSWLTHGSVWDDNYKGLWHANGTVVDSTTHANDATADNSVSVSGNIGGGKSFNGSDQRVELGDLPDFDLLEDMTLSAWVKPTPASSGRRNIISKWADGYIFQLNNRRMSVHIDGWQDGTTQLTGSQWDLATMTFDDTSNTLRFYLNGQLDREVTGYNGNSGTGGILYFGRRDNGEWFTGEMDEFRMSDIVRSPDWLEANYDNQVQGSGFNTFGTVESKPAIDIVYAVSNLTASAADLSASLTSTGSAETTVWVYWGLSDGGSVPGSWASNELYGIVTTMPSNYVKNLSGLADSTQYFYSFAASNVYGTTWAASNFWTYGRPAVDNGTGADAGIGYAVMNGSVVSTGGAPTTAYIYWGDNDGGTGPWDHEIAIGPHGVGSFSASTTSNLIYGVQYYYRTYVTNSYGDRWAPASAGFTTLPPVPPDGVPVTAGLEGWYDAGYGVVADGGGIVQSWADRSGNGNHAEQRINNPRLESDQVNGLPAVLFHGGNNRLNINYPLVPREEYIVFRSGRYAYDPGNPNLWGGDWGGPFGQQNNNGWMCQQHTRDLWDDGNRRPNGVTWNGTVIAETNPDGFPYGLPNVADYMVLKVNPRNYGSANCILGRPNNNWGNGYVDVAEVLIYNTPLSAADENDVGGYLAWKYGISTSYSWAPPVYISVTNTVAANLGGYSATLQGELDATNATFQIYAYWGETNGGDNAGAWMSNAYVGTYTNILDYAFSNNITGLTPGTAYYYTFRALNAATNIWADPSGSFETVGAPTVSNRPPTVLGSALVTASGYLAKGGEATTTVYWGRTDQGSTGTWDYATSVGTVFSPSTFNTNLATLAGATYYYRCYATNAFGDDWADSTTNFTTPVVAVTLAQVGTTFSEEGIINPRVTATLNATSAVDVTVNFTYSGSGPGETNVFVAGGLEHRGYHKSWVNEDLYLHNNGGLMAMTPYGTATLTSGPGDRGLDFNNDGDFTATGAVGQNDWYMNLFIGYFRAPTTGSYEFRIEQDDDRSGMWLDLDRDGIFESSPTGLGTGRGEQLAWENGSTRTVFLTAGHAYMFAVTHAEGGGGSGIDARIKTPSMGAEAIIKPADPAQAGLWGQMYTAATYPSDYTATPTSVVVSAGSLSGYVTISAVDDSTPEDTEGISVSYASALNATSAVPQTYVSFTLTNGDPGVDNANGATDLASDGTVTLNGTLNAGVSADASIYYGTTDGGTSTGAWDSVGSVGNVTEDVVFSAAVSGLTASKTYYYRCYVTNAANENWALSTTNFTMPAATVSIGDVTVVEGHSGTTSAVFPITLSAPSALAISVNYATANGTATAGSDYTSVSGTLNIPAGTSSTQLVVAVTGDREIEVPSEAFGMTLSAPVNCTIADGSAVCTVVDDEGDAHMADWAYKMKITFSGYAGSETLTNFTALVRLSTGITGFDYGDVQSSTGRDLAFMKPDGTLLNYEIENWDTGGESPVWVQIPELTASTYIWMYWGSATDIPTATEITAATDVSGCALWLDGSDIDGQGDGATGDPSVGQVVTSWVDKSGNGVSAVPETGDASVANGANGTHVVYFDGNDYMYTEHNFDHSLAQYTILSVARYTGGANNRVISSRTQNWLYGFHGNSVNRFHPNGWVYNGGGSDSSWHLHAATMSGDENPRGSFWNDGNNLVTDNTGSNDWWSKPGQLGLGGYRFNSELSRCEVAEVIIYDRVLTADELNRVGYYLEQKYGLTTSYTAPGTFEVPNATEEAAWSSENLGVWHMTEPNVLDSTSFEVNGRNYGTTTDANGYIGPAQSYNNTFTRLANRPHFNQGDKLTASCWVRVDGGWRSNWQRFMGTRGEGNMGWQLRRYSNWNRFCLTTRTLGWDDNPYNNADGVQDGNWHHIAATFEYNAGGPTTKRVYMNGQLVGSQTVNNGMIPDVTDNNRWPEIGACDNGGNRHRGRIDEARIEHIVRSEDWIAARYSNEVVNSTFSAYSAAYDLRLPEVAIKHAVTNLAGSWAYLDSSVISTGHAETAVWMYWDQADGGSDPAAWGNTQYMGTVSSLPPVTMSSNVTGLAGDTLYYYAYRVSNSYGQAWASTNFTTLVAPEVNNYTGASVGVGEATLTGELTTGNLANIYIYWGRTDGGTDHSAWESVESLGQKGHETFQTTVSAYYGMRYYYRCYATNNLGDNWAVATTNFITLDPTSGNYWNALYYGRYAGSGSADLGAIDDGVANGENGGLFDLTPDGGTPTVWTSEIWPGTDGNTYSKMWWGYFHPPLTGTYEFYVHGDDYELLWIDTGQNGGEFEAGEDDISRNVPPEGWNTPHTETVDLTGGGEQYAFAIAMNEGGGGDWMNITIKKPGGAAERINPSIAAQDGWWSLGETVAGSEIANGVESGVTTTSATFSATLSCPQSIFDVYAFWGTTDGVDDASAWASNSYVGTYTNVDSEALSYTAVGLATDADHYYTFQATNDVTNLWASPSEPFATLGMLDVSNTVPSNVTASAAAIGAQLVNGGAGDTTIYWGPTDGDTNIVDWANAESFGTLSIPTTITTNLTGLLADKTYYCRVYSSNMAGVAWAPSTTNFTTDEATVSIDDVTVTEGDSGTVSAVFTVTLSAVSGTEVTLQVDTADGTAEAGSDYTGISGGAFGIPAGNPSGTITVTVRGDTHGEWPSETYTVNLSAPVNCSIGDGEGSGTITDDDLAEYLSRWGCKLKITFSGYSGTETLIDFPALVRLGEHLPSFLYSSFEWPENGADLRFADANEITLLNHEIEKWDTNGTSLVWVQVPEVSTDSHIWAYWARDAVAHTAALAGATDLEDCILWVDASDIDGGGDGAVGDPTNGQTVATWDDRSAGDHDATQDTEASKPVVLAGAVNGQTALRFDGGDDYLTVADESNFDQLKYLTVVVVGQARSGIGGWEPFVSKRGEGQGWQMRRQGGNNYATFTVRGTSGADDPAGSTAIVDHWRLYIGTYDGAKRKLWVDGNLEIDLADTGNISDTGDSVMIGGRYNARSDVDIAEVAMFSRALNDVELNRLGYYLSQKYGLSTSYTSDPVAVPPSYARDGSTWSSEYLGVWHMHRRNPTDSTSAKNNGRSDGTLTVAGLLGDAQQYNNNWIRIPDREHFNHGDRVTASVWARVDGGWRTRHQAFISHRGEGNMGWQLRRRDNQNRMRWTTRGLANQDMDGTYDVNPADGQWHHLMGVWDGSTKYIYIDGELDSSVGTSGTIADVTDANRWPEIGSKDNGGERHRGLIDEARIEHVARSADWIKARFDNEKPTPTFATYGSVSWTPRQTLFILW